MCGCAKALLMERSRSPAERHLKGHRTARSRVDAGGRSNGTICDTWAKTMARRDEWPEIKAEKVASKRPVNRSVKRPAPVKRHKSRHDNPGQSGARPQAS